MKQTLHFANVLFCNGGIFFFFLMYIPFYPGYSPSGVIRESRARGRQNLECRLLPTGAICETGVGVYVKRGICSTVKASSKYFNYVVGIKVDDSIGQRWERRNTRNNFTRKKDLGKQVK